MSTGLEAQNTDTFGGGWGAFTDGLTDTFSSALDLGLKYELFKQAKDNDGQGQGDIVNAVTQDSQPNAAPTSVNPTGQNNTNEWVSGIDNKIVVGGGLLLALALIKVKI